MNVIWGHGGKFEIDRYIYRERAYNNSENERIYRVRHQEHGGGRDTKGEEI